MTAGSDRADGAGPTDKAGAWRPVGESSGERGAAAPWVGIVANRGSGVGRGRRLVEQLVYELRRLGISAEVAWSPEARSALVERAAGDRQCRCLVAVGGDGTVSALLNERPGRPITVMPAGTENLVARHFGLRRDPHGLARTIAAGRSVPVDVAQADGRRFLLMAGFGFDADVVTRHHRGRISHTGRAQPTSRFAYVAPILRASFSYRFPTISVRVLDPGTEEVLRGTTVFIFNLPRYALGLPFVPVAREDDGWLDLVIFRHPGPFRALYYLWKVCCGVHLHDPSVYHRRVRRVVVTSREAIPVQLDGDPGGYVLPTTSASAMHGAAGGGPPTDGDGAIAAGAVDHRHADWLVEILPSGMTMLVPPRRGGDRTGRPPLVSDGRT
jgi:diacylglycerol kinase family enzyme